MRSVAVEIPWDEVSQERARLVRKVAPRATVPGFRRGKAPASVLNQVYKKEILGGLADGLVIKRLVDEVGRRDVHVAWGPIVDDILLVEGEPLVATGFIEVFPKFELGKYRGLKVEFLEIEVTDKMVENHLEDLRRRHGTYQNVDPRPAKDGDVVSINLEGSSGGESPEVPLHETRLIVGQEGTIPEFNDAIRGLSPGDAAEFEVAYPDDYEAEELAGGTLTFKAELLGISELELPDLDDEFAKDVDESLEGIDDLRAKSWAFMEDLLERQTMEQARESVILQLAEAHPMPMPPLYFASRMAQVEEDAPADQRTDDDRRTRTALEVIRVRADLVLDRIAEVENLTVTQAETQTEIENYARERQMTPKAAHEELAENGALSTWMRRHRRLKALNLVIDEAQRVASPSPDDDDSDESEKAEE